MSPPSCSVLIDLCGFLLAEARAVAISRDCKYVEVSASLGHNVDTLLVGVVKQIRLKLAELAERSSYAK